MKRKLIITITIIVLVLMLYYSNRENIVLCATKYFQYKQSQKEYFSFKYRELDSLYNIYPVDKICFIYGNNLNIEEYTDGIIYVTNSDSIKELLTQNGKVSLCLSESAYPYILNKQSCYLLCKIESVRKQRDSNVYKLYKTKR